MKLVSITVRNVIYHTIYRAGLMLHLCPVFAAIETAILSTAKNAFKKEEIFSYLVHAPRPSIRRIERLVHVNFVTEKRLQE